MCPGAQQAGLTAPFPVSEPSQVFCGTGALHARPEKAGHRAEKRLPPGVCDPHRAVPCPGKAGAQLRVRDSLMQSCLHCVALC